MTSWVKAGEHGWIELEEAEFLNVLEDPSGRDVITFEYEGIEYESLCVIGHNPPG